MKKLIKIALILIVLIVLLFGGAAFLVVSNADKLIASAKPAIEKKASSVLNADFKVGNISLSFFPTLKAKVAGISLARPGESKGFELNNIFLELDFLKIFSGEIKIKNLEINEPSITLIKDASGVYLQGLPKPDKNSATEKEKSAAAGNPPGSAQLPQGTELIKASLSAFSLKNANVLFQDQIAHKEYAISKVNLSSELELAANALALNNINLNGLLLNQTSFGSKIKKISVDLNTLKLDIPEGALALAEQSLPFNADFVVPQQKGGFNLNTKTFAIGSVIPLAKTLVPALSALNLAGNLAIDLKTTLDQGAFTLDNKASVTSLVAENGPIGLKGEIPQLDLSVNANLSNLIPSLKGQGVFVLKDGAITGLNLAAKIIQAVSLKGNFLSALGQAQGLPSGNDTAISLMKVSYDISNSTVSLKDIDIQSPVFTFKGSGSLSFGMNVNLSCVVTFSTEISAVLASQIKELENVLDEQKRLVIPLTISGTVPSLTILPDVNALLKGAAGNIIKNQIEKEAGKLLNKFKF
jgi:hypothetical protein